MGKLLITAKYIFLIYGADLNEKRRHIHVTFARRGFKNSCKFWLEPKIQLVEEKRSEFNEIELREIEKLIYKNKLLIDKQLDKFYNLEKVEAIQI